MLRRDWKGAVDRLIGVSDSVRDEQWQEAIRQYHNGNLEAALSLLPRHCRTERDVLQRLISKPGEWEKSFSVINPRLRKLYLSAYQSFLFDRVVEQRLDEIDQVFQGDLAWKHINGACFLVEDADTEASRAANFEISATGPMFGCKMKLPGGDIFMLEQKVLSDELISLENFDMSGGLRMEGERRPLRVALEKPVISAVDGALILEFALPKGSYATSVIREITKTF
jgi:tRNA pseudouridine13 synthase